MKPKTKASKALSEVKRAVAEWSEATTCVTGAQLIVPIPHRGQQEFLDSDHPQRLLACHRRFGKDWACIMDLRRRIERWKDEPHRKQLSPAISIGVIYPNYPLAGEFWDALKRMTPREEVVRLNESKPSVMELKSGAKIEVRTGSDPDMLVAAGYDLAIFGEAARLPKAAWLTTLPALASPGRSGLAVHQTTLKGQNWIAEELRSPHWWKLHVPVWKQGTQERHELANPHITDAAIEKEQREMPERWFNQEWLAEVLSGEGAVFRNVRDRTAAAPNPPKSPLVCGVDLAKHSDYSVFAVFDADGHMVTIERMNAIGYQVQAERLITLLATHGVRKAVIESNGPGEPFFDMVSRDIHERRDEFLTRCELIPFATTAQSKRQMIDALTVAFERGQITLLPDEELLNEFEAFEMSQSVSGHYRFSAPEGGWDDRVMACALAWTESATRKVAASAIEQNWGPM